MSIPTPSDGGNGKDGHRQPVHKPVLLSETLAVLEPAPGQVFVDGTVGAGGHAREVARLLVPGGMVLGLDRDSEILDCARASLAEFKDAPEQLRVSLVNLPYSRMQEALAVSGQAACDRVLLDLGVSSLQLDKAERGFSFMADGPLDMRMGADCPRTAADWLATVSERELADVIFQLGDERHSRRIARAVVEQRRQASIRTTGQLRDIILRALPAPARRQRIHPATRTFQAIRMVVNDEIGELERGLAAARSCLRPGGRLAVISFHSNEDRIVKRFLKQHFDPVTKKPITADFAEVRQNPRARSAKLRCGIKRAVDETEAA